MLSSPNLYHPHLLLLISSFSVHAFYSCSQIGSSVPFLLDSIYAVTYDIFSSFLVRFSQPKPIHICTNDLILSPLHIDNIPLCIHLSHLLYPLICRHGLLGCPGDLLQEHFIFGGTHHFGNRRNSVTDNMPEGPESQPSRWRMGPGPQRMIRTGVLGPGQESSHRGVMDQRSGSQEKTPKPQLFCGINC